MLRIISLFLFATAAYFCWWAITYKQWVWFAPAIIMAGIGVGLIMRWKWAAYLWILFAASTTSWWVYGIISIKIVGWPHTTLTDTIISLIPGSLLTIICITGSVTVYKKLRNGSYVS